MDNKSKDILSEMQGKYYDIEIFKNKYDLSMNPNDFKNVETVKYNHVLLVNVNGLGMGQVHFVEDDGSYLLLPWGYILTMKPNVAKIGL